MKLITIQDQDEALIIESDGFDKVSEKPQKPN